MRTVTILTTGGTIACSRTKKGLSPTLTGEELASSVNRSDCRIKVRELMRQDSTNIGPGEWKLLAQAVFDALGDSDGIVIVHGTDTMAYTAAALARMLQNLHCPVVLTGAMRPLTEPGSDGAGNLQDAVTAALSDLAGVMVVFGGRVIRGDCARKIHTDCDDAFRSINAPQLGSIRDGRFKAAAPAPAREGDPPTLDTRLEDRIAAFVLYPGFSPSLLSAALAGGCRGILLAACGSGGLPDHSDLAAVLRQADARGVPVVMVTQCAYGGVDLGRYEPGVLARELGCRDAGERTFEAALVDLMWELGHSDHSKLK